MSWARKGERKEGDDDDGLDVLEWWWWRRIGKGKKRVGGKGLG